jgi:hypothetical protein
MTGGGSETMEDRYKHLLQPIRDLAQNWGIDVADELTKYLDEVGYFPMLRIFAVDWSFGHF